MSRKPSKTEIQLQLFEDALERLLRNEGKHISPGKKLSIALLAKEAAVGSGTLYYNPYNEFRKRACDMIAQYNKGKREERGDIVNQHDLLQSLRKERDNERRLKVQYRESCDNLKLQVHRLSFERGTTEHALYQATLRIAELEAKIENLTSIHTTSSAPEPAGNIMQLPRNLQKRM
ncbi:hypothetical protein OVA10_23175 [Lelliottia sp. SL45]|uniref:hypothetical protein n=1 Tax=Lelliottia sp. SL45 TaxID=2994665 RepID=UPI002275AF2B|nr:hypothetical protein [Lelliottia sp. SL45]MCY1700928.1 hypothetical protein [Lelliottia sp. SL45]